MKVDFLINHSSLLEQQKPKHGLESYSNRERMCARDCNNVNRGYNSGSSVSFGSAADFSIKTLNKINTLCQKHKTIAQNLVALVLAVGFRPIAIMSLPGKKDKDDKIYASGHSMASGLIGFAFSSIVMYPLGIAAQKLGNESKIIQSRLLKAKEAGKQLTNKEILKDLKFLNEKFLNIFGKFTKDGKIIHNAGDYKFKGVPGGNYVVRFIYGTNKMLLDDLHGVTGSPVAVNAEGGKFYDKNDTTK